MRIGDYVIGYQGDDETAQCGKCGSDMEPVRPGKWQCPKCELEEMIQQAHRQGWEQGKREAVAHLRYQHNLVVGEASLDYLATLEQCWNAIASMEYKEGKANDR